MRRLLPLIVIFLQCSCENTSRGMEFQLNDSLTHKQQPESIYLSSGKGLFQQNCSGCHAIHKVIYGPPLANVARIRTAKWTFKLITDTTFVLHDSVKNILGKQLQRHVQFPSLSRQDIDSIWNYIVSSREPPAIVFGQTSIVYCY